MWWAFSVCVFCICPTIVAVGRLVVTNARTEKCMISNRTCKQTPTNRCTDRTVCCLAGPDAAIRTQNTHANVLGGNVQCMSGVVG